MTTITELFERLHRQTECQGGAQMEHYVLDALQTATAKMLERTVHHFHFDIVDAEFIPTTSIHHTNIAVEGNHTEQSQSWEGRVVKNDLMNIDKLHRLRAHLQHDLELSEIGLISLTIIYLEERRQFGFSILTQGK